MCCKEPGKHLPNDEEVAISRRLGILPTYDGHFGRIGNLDLPSELFEQVGCAKPRDKKRLIESILGRVEEPIALEEGNEISVFDPESFNKHESLWEYLDRRGIDLGTFDDERLSECITRQMKTPKEV